MSVSVGLLTGTEPGEIIGFLVVIADITERKQHEAQVNHLNTELEKNLDELLKANAALKEEITERQAVEAELHESRDKLIANEEQMKHYAAELVVANTELKKFANIVAHDFRSPMVNLKGFSKELITSLEEV